MEGSSVYARERAARGGMSGGRTTFPLAGCLGVWKQCCWFSGLGITSGYWVCSGEKMEGVALSIQREPKPTVWPAAAHRRGLVDGPRASDRTSVGSSSTRTVFPQSVPSNAREAPARVIALEWLPAREKKSKRRLSTAHRNLTWARGVWGMPVDA